MSRPSHPDELPRFDVLDAERLEQELAPASVRRPAASGHEVQLLQKLLILHGCELHFSGVFDQNTFEALRHLQRRLGLTITGRTDAATRERLNALLASAREREDTVRRLWYLVYPYRKQQQLPTEGESAIAIQAWLNDLLTEIADPEADQPLPALQKPERPMLQTLLGPLGQQGLTHTGTEVTRLQETLQSLGYRIHISHSFDLQTFNVLRQFQQAQGLVPNGLADPPTRARLNPALHVRYEREKAWEGLMAVIRDFQHRHRLGTRPAIEGRLLEVLLQLLGEAVLPIRCPIGPPSRRDVQSLGPDVLLLKCFLSQQGYGLEPDMAFDSATAECLREFQREHRLPRSGYADAASLALINRLRSLPGVPSLLPGEDLIE